MEENTLIFTPKEMIETCQKDLQGTSSSKLHIIGNQFFLTEFLFESVRNHPDIVIHFHPRKRRGAYRSLLKLWEAYSCWPIKDSFFFPQDYISQLAQIGERDSVLIFGVENIKELKIIKKIILSRKISIFTWNPVVDFNQNKWFRSMHIKQLKKIGVVFTFDPLNARDYNLKLIDQVYRDVDEYQKVNFQSNTIQNVYFVGQDKGRLSQLRYWDALLRSMAIRVLFVVVGDRNKRYSLQEREFLSPQGVGYEENICNILGSDCLFEIVQSNQSGLTVRSMEAFFFGKKLITNNKWICQAPLYSPDRVFVIGKDDVNGLRDFIAKPIARLSSAELSRYEFKNWCQRFR